MGDGDYFRGEKASCSEAGYSTPCSAAAKNENLWLAKRQIYHYLYLPKQLVICLLPEVQFKYEALGAHCVYLYLIPLCFQ